MSAPKRKNLIAATMAFLVSELGGRTQIEAVGSFAGADGNLFKNR